MIEVTLDKNLVSSERPTFPVLHPLVDLTQDLTAARAVIAAAVRFFWLPRQASYSGHARKLDSFDGETGSFGPCFYVQVWEKGELLRTVGFRNLGYVGVLHVDIPEGEPFNNDSYNDLIGDLCRDVPGVCDDYARGCIGYVDEGRLEIAVPYSGGY